ncbi:hypothetical protein HDA32_004801 [Spinactinospora alkalitolerans]|uniref:Glycosyltransferase RgtA/B/C/D-like domain-containing protein n=1 Tax=Spinactinospora alkalitolerans TaxID=687207 RepID=A0A852U0P8_9ACTN|nr:hypothetical protein [Spinactinospora alkalitolerans]NYE49681.1 hypothetical protein [Spinactinospora alkalitolerans]
MRMTPARLFARVTVVPAVAFSAWLLVAFPLLLLGHFTPVTGVVLGVPAVVAAVAVVPRWVPDPAEDDIPWWPVIAVGVIVLAFAAVQLAYHSEQLVIRRDAASYAQYTVWIAQNGYLPIPQQRELIAGDDPALAYNSLAYYQVGDQVWPQFLAGTPLLLSVGYWIGGLDGMVVLPPLIGALGVLTFAGLAARLIGARWAPLAALTLAVCLPEQWISRSTYSEPATQVLLLGALALAHDGLTRRTALRDRWGAPHALALAAGLAFGLSLAVRIDVLRDVLPVVGFLGLLLLARRGQAVPMLIGLAVGLGYGFTAGFVLSRPYLEYLSASLDPLLAVAAVVVVLTAAATALLWRRGVPRTDRPAWLPTATAALAVLVMAGFAVRPLVHVQRGHGDEATAHYIGQVQEVEGLPFDPDRTYEEMSLYWVGWYVGLAAVLLATAGVALLLRRVMRRQEPRWVLPLMVLIWTVTTTLIRPAITPDHPWASRRLIVLVIPAFILLAVWFLAWAIRWIRAHPARPPAWLPASVAALGAAALLIPTGITASGIMTYRMDVGSVAGTRALCAQIPDDGSVVIVDAGTASMFEQLIRGNCGVPTAHVNAPDQVSVQRVVGEIEQRGRRAVLVGSSPDQLLPYLPNGTRVSHPFDVHTDQDPSTLMEPPSGAWRFNADVWLAVVP